MQGNVTRRARPATGAVRNTSPCTQLFAKRMFYGIFKGSAGQDELFGWRGTMFTLEPILPPRLMGQAPCFRGCTLGSALPCTRQRLARMQVPELVLLSDLSGTLPPNVVLDFEVGIGSARLAPRFACERAAGCATSGRTRQPCAWPACVAFASLGCARTHATASFGPEPVQRPLLRHPGQQLRAHSDSHKREPGGRCANLRR
jgi:hypothetical protein